ncbi:hypothetical protein AR438_13235 [Chryseobacterium aquaticum]|uniref:Uncharacterized protein n=1 Tax=Chryseobacterium aquaticum TaxID=452084 RepID=A0A0Q3KL29_9FLAO|nr:hypothetical protein [Chryseobacterium aquaticum]KQK24892.1 hypothetical protein AR438_13235 [Chryseobacterium aquaticum]
MENINLELRGIVLKYSLELEHAVNKIFISFLSIENAMSTRHFGNRAGMSFQQKIDLLYDLNILEKNELPPIELLMNFRNRFLHNINYNSFEKILQDLDNSLVNRFKKYCVKDMFDCEEDYLITFKQLYIEILDILNAVIKKRKEENDRKMNLILEHVKDLYDLKLLVFQYILNTKANLANQVDKNLMTEKFKENLLTDLDIWYC